MKKINYFIFAAAAMTIAGCANDEFTGNGAQPTGNTPIAFNLETGAQTRSTESGENAATKLGKEFIVWGEKNETGGTAAADKDKVFENYRVKWTQNTAGTTLSNTKDWEYVGIKPYKSDYVSPSIYQDDNTVQTIKYWDMGATSYTFTAVSAAESDITNGKVKITKITNGTNATDKGYTIDLGADATPGSIYVSDRKVITAPTGTITPGAEDTYGGFAKLVFRNFQTKIRFAMYETIPGYKVKVNSVGYNSTTSTSNFGVDGDFVTAGTGTKYKVTYDDNNKAVVALDGTTTPSKDTYLQAGTNLINTELGTASTSPTYDQSDKSYTAIQPNPSNTTNMKFTISYTLISEDTQEEIKVENKTAEVPAAYCQWKNNYAYTYIFKITDSSAELYPITFDAVVETDEIGNQETITTVTEPSITTFAVTSTGAVVTGKNEYGAGDVIYASVVKDHTAATDLSTNTKLYTVSTTDDNFPITEASVAHSIKLKAAGGTDAHITATEVTLSTTDNFVTEVPAEDGSGNARSLSALKWTAEASKVYAVEYKYTDTTGGSSTEKKIYKIVRIQN